MCPSAAGLRLSAAAVQPPGGVPEVEAGGGRFLDLDGAFVVLTP